LDAQSEFLLNFELILVCAQEHGSYLTIYLGYDGYKYILAGNRFFPFAEHVQGSSYDNDSPKYH
jgi:hypothetical protein